MKPVSLSQSVSEAQQEILVDFSRPPPAPIILQCSDTQKFIRMSLVITVEWSNLSHKYYYSRSDPTHAVTPDSRLNPFLRPKNTTIFLCSKIF